MKNFIAFLLSKKGWQDKNGNTVVFSEKSLTGECEENKIWMFLDEGLRCGGMNRLIEPKPQILREILMGIGKDALWREIESDWIREE